MGINISKLNNSGIGIAGALAASLVFGFISYGLLTAIQSQQAHRLRASFSRTADKVSERVSVFLTRDPVCSQLLQGIDPVNNDFWATNPRSLSSPSSATNESIVAVGNYYGVPEIELTGLEIGDYTPLDSSDPLYGTATLYLVFSGKNAFKEIAFVKQIPLSLNLEVMNDSSNNQYNGIASCRAIGNLPNCLDGDTLVVKEGTLACGSSLNLASIANRDRDMMPARVTVDTPNAYGQKSVTAQPYHSHLLTSASAYDSGTGGIQLLQTTRQSQVSGLMRFIGYIPWRNKGPDYDPNAMFGVIYVRQQGTSEFKIAGEGLIGKPYEYDVSSGVAYRGSSGGGGIVYGEFPVEAGVNYEIQLRAVKFKFDGPDFQTFQIGSIYTHDHAVDGYLEIYEIARGKKNVTVPSQ